MAKHFILVSILLVLALFSGCTTNSLDEYQQALNNNAQMISGRKSIDLSVQLDFDRLQFSDNQDITILGDVVVKSLIAFDKVQRKVSARNHLTFEEMGYDLNFYQRDNISFIMTPVIPKYLRMEIKGSPMMNFNDFEDIANIWKDLLEKENVFKKENTIVATPDGQIKVREFIVELNDEQVKDLIRDVVSKLLESNNISIEFNFEDLLVNDFKYRAYVDKDNFIIDETFSLDISFPDVSKGPRSFKLNYSIQNFDINRSLTIDIPEINEENSIDINELQGELPEGLFR